MERENAGAAMDQPTEEEEPAGVSGTKQYTTKEDGSDEKVIKWSTPSSEEC